MGFERSRLSSGGLSRADIMGARSGTDTAELGMGPPSLQASSIRASDALAQNSPNGGLSVPTEGSPVAGLIAIAVIIFMMRFAANKVGESNEYSALEPTFFNVMLITLASILGITLMKFASAKLLREGNAFRRLIFSV